MQTYPKFEDGGNHSRGPWPVLASRESREREEEGEEVREGGQTPVYWGVMKETQLAILGTQVDC